MPFELLDRGLAPEFVRRALPILDLREIAAEKIAAFWRRRKARDLYDLEHLGRALQTDFDGPAIAALAALKIYFDVVDEGLGRLLTALDAIFNLSPAEVSGADDLGYFRVATVDVAQLLVQCAHRYAVFGGVDGEIARLVTTCNQRDLWTAQQLKDEVVAQLTEEG